MFVVLTFVLAGVLAVVAPRFGTDSRPGFNRPPNSRPHGI